MKIDQKTLVKIIILRKIYFSNIGSYCQGLQSAQLLIVNFCIVVYQIVEIDLENELIQNF